MDAANYPQLRRAARTTTAYVTLIALLLLTAVSASGQASPEVRIIDPLADAIVTGEIHWEAEVEGDVRSVDFYVDTEKVWTEYSAPYEYHRADGYMAYDTAVLTDGTHTLRVVANLADGTRAEAAIRMTVANHATAAPKPTPSPTPVPTGMPSNRTPLVVAIVDPPANATVRGEIHWEADVDGKAKTVDFYVDTKKVWTEYDEPYEYHRADGYMAFDTATLTDGAHTLRVVANKPNGDSAETAISVTVSNAVAAPPPPPVAPTNTAQPSVSGSTTVGQTLSASVGTWAGTTPLTYTRAWERCMAGACASIPRASGATYTLVAADVGATIRHSVTATNAAGSAVARSAQTAAVAAAEPTASTTPPSNTAPPTIAGTATIGQTLSATAGTWTGTSPMTFARAWERCVAGTCAVIGGATAATYTLVAADFGATLRHTVIATNVAGSATARSAQTATVLGDSPTAPQSIEAPTVSGTATVGQKLTATLGTWAGSTPMAFALAWERCSSGACSPISGASAVTYTLVAADAGNTVRHVVTATNAVGSAVARSAETSIVQSLPVNTAPPTIVGTPTVGQTLTATTGTWTGATPMAYTRAWERCATSSSCSPIAGASAATYTPVAADVGATLRHAVTATNTVGAAVARSAQTVIVQAAPAPSGNFGTSLPSRMPESTGPSYYVDGARGSDSNTGTISAPWRTINKALATVPLSGSIINVRAGTYVGTHQLVDRTGSGTNPITLQAYPGERVLLTTPAGAQLNTLVVNRAGGLRIRGFEITAPGALDGVRIESSRNVELVGCEIHDTGRQGLLVAGTGTSAPTTSHNIHVWSNRFHDNGGYSATLDHSLYWGGSYPKVVGLDHTTYGGVIANNLFYGQPNGFQLHIGSQADGLIATNNTFYRASGPWPAGGTIAIWTESETPEFVTRNVLVVNNLITHANSYGVYGSGGGGLMSTNRVRNNLAYGNGRGDFLSYYGTTDRVLFQLGPNFTGQSPQFVNPDAQDFRLQSGSPAIGKADPAYAPETDYTGRARSGAAELGALEY